MPAIDQPELPMPGLPRPAEPPPEDPGELMDVSEAAEVLGIDRHQVVALWENGYVEGFRPAPNRIKLFRQSVTNHREETEDPEFWERERKAKPHLFGSGAWGGHRERQAAHGKALKPAGRVVAPLVQKPRK